MKPSLTHSHSLNSCWIKFIQIFWFFVKIILTTSKVMNQKFERKTQKEPIYKGKKYRFACW